MTSAATDSDAPAPSLSLGRLASRGFVWQFGFTIIAKIISTVGQIVIAWFLLPSEFGLVGMTWTVIALAGLVQNIGVQDVLVQRQQHLRRWANAAHWMSLAAGVVAMATALAAMPLAARWYRHPELAGMIALLSLSLPLRALLVVPQARLSSSLRFRTDAVINSAAAMATMLLSIALAILGAGPYAMIAPVPLVLVAQAIVLWWVAPVAVRAKPQMRRWRFLVGDTAYSWAVMALIAVTLQIGYVLLSIRHSAEAVGLFFVAFNLSTQVFTLLIGNLMMVLLPSLSLLASDPQRQTRAFLEATRLVVAIGLPACWLLAAIAYPLIATVYRDEYAGIAPLLAMLAIGMGLYLPAGAATSMMKAQGRFRTLCAVFAAMAALVVAAMLAATAIDDGSAAAQRVALCTTIIYGVFGPIFLIVTVAGRAPIMASLVRVYGTPMLASALAVGPALALALAIPASGIAQPLRLAVTIAVAAIVCPLAIRWIDPPLWSSLLQRFGALMPARMRRREA